MVYRTRRPVYRRTRRTFRRSTVKRRAYPTTKRRTFRRRRFVKRVLNVSTRKKVDKMMPIAGSILTPGSIGSTRITAVPDMTGQDFDTQFYIWCPTARANLASAGNPGSVFDSATRTASNCYIRGLKEKINIETRGAASWYWRRIVFFMKGTDFLRDETDIVRIPYQFNTDHGTMRLVGSTGSDPTFQNGILGLIFLGFEGNDWIDPITAKTDKTRVRIAYDKTRMIKSGNDFGTTKSFNMWHGVNKTLEYQDDQAGGREQAGLLSSFSERSCGDMYVFDMFRNNRQASDQDWLDFTPEAQLFWHER